MELPEKLTDEQATQMLAKLREHFNQPVMPIDRYCDALRTWSKCMGERATTLRNSLFPGMTLHWDTPEHKAAQEEYRRLSDIPNRLSTIMKDGGNPTRWDYDFEELLGYERECEKIARVELLIRKSSLLDRLLYSGEKLRTEICPIHKGHWSGLEFGDNCCPHKCHLTGWIVQPEDEAKYDIRVLPQCPTCGEPYDKHQPTMRARLCSSGYHCCRDCTWRLGEVTKSCPEHEKDPNYGSNWDKQS